ncbi:MAG: hypothetical protein IKM92_01615 [Bacteroidaceae bacterium]|nr:hypothetical protein [Bacteroidaceae bacterium]
MKKIKNILLLVSMLLVNTAYAQRVQNIEDWMNSLISKAIDNNVEVTKSLGRERDIQKEGTPLKWRCDIYQFSLPKKLRPLLDEMIKAFEANGNDNPNCYGINTLTTINPQNEGKRNLIIGDDINRYVTIGEQYGNYVNVNILDATDTTKTHRYAYALEWKEDSRDNVIARYIVTYAKIPSKQNRYGKVPIQDKVLIKGDSLFNVIREVNGKPLKAMGVAVNQSVAGVNTLLIFSALKKYYQKHKDAELTAISIYSLCKRANEEGLFRDDSLGELEQLICEVDKLTENAKTETDRTYFQKAREQLDEIMKSRK